MKKCYFCGAKAPEMTKELGIYKLNCSCGHGIEYWNKDLVLEMWNYDVLK